MNTKLANLADKRLKACKTAKEMKKEAAKLKNIKSATDKAKTKSLKSEGYE